MTNKHVHAELMLQYANDAMTSDRPWERWESRGDETNWISLRNHPHWDDGLHYRRKPQTFAYERTVMLRKGDKNCPIGMNKLPSGSNVRFTFDTDSGKLVGVELIKE